MSDWLWAPPEQSQVNSDAVLIQSRATCMGCLQLLHDLARWQPFQQRQLGPGTKLPGCCTQSSVPDTIAALIASCYIGRHADLPGPGLPDMSSWLAGHLFVNLCPDLYVNRSFLALQRVGVWTRVL
jgi:hypothetical protein